MNEHTTKLIQDLADKLGTTAEHLWGVLVRQASLSATWHLVDFVIVLGASIILWMACYRTAKKAINSDFTNEDILGVLSVILGVIAVFGTTATIIALSGMDMMLAGFFNPEYWALKQILK